MLSVLTFNICEGWRLEKIIHWIQTLKRFDIICFQEFPKKRISGFVNAFSDVKYGYSYTLSIQTKKKTLGQLTLYRKDKIKLVSSSVLLLGDSKVEKAILRKWAPRKSLITTYQTKTQTFTIANTHLVCVALNAHRYKQIHKILTKLEHHTVPSLILGDFNLPNIIGKKKLVRLMNSHSYVTQKNRMATWGVAGVPYQVDYVFWKSCVVEDLHSVRVRFSDHFPVVFKLRFSP